ncbi:uncharacterized protein LOC103691948 [Rattus norvegicus]|uniref:uncharacterized protein LOC103691948 n=1 Tax=Rattus norvegicus TaxID=10116 RepID=UPI0004E4761A|nr:uncharacterized protein LOC103691948 [Rattus norvegicus]|eukprot:XP_008760661.1 PREDICTED: uncharacterized protein LOC103691948 [Rattus norvegicus]
MMHSVSHLLPSWSSVVIWELPRPSVRRSATSQLGQARITEASKAGLRTEREMKPCHGSCVLKQESHLCETFRTTCLNLLPPLPDLLLAYQPGPIPKMRLCVQALPMTSSTQITSAAVVSEDSGTCLVAEVNSMDVYHGSPSSLKKFHVSGSVEAGCLLQLPKRDHSPFVAVHTVPPEPCESGGKYQKGEVVQASSRVPNSGRQQLNQALIKPTQEANV